MRIVPNFQTCIMKTLFGKFCPASGNLKILRISRIVRRKTWSGKEFIHEGVKCRLWSSTSHKVVSCIRKHAPISKILSKDLTPIAKSFLQFWFSQSCIAVKMYQFWSQVAVSRNFWWCGSFEERRIYKDQWIFKYVLGLGWRRWWPLHKVIRVF